MLPSPDPKSHYLSFVDGLRAVSILAVVAFHIGLPGVSGGYVGVDIFFVISGFLIINIIRTELEQSRFSILSFYARRSLRILPPLLVMLVAVYLVAPFILPSPHVYRDFWLSALLSPLMATNILFYLKQGYFDVDADEKPLLHTWTLSVEEQFYFAAPLLLMLIFYLGRKRFGTSAAVFAILLGAVSFAGAIMETSMVGRNAAFYLPYWRAWEFIMGGLISRPLAMRASRTVTEVSGWAGAILILVAITQFDATTAYPSWRAMVPVLGASLVIFAGLGQPQNSVARLLAWRPFVFIGLVSYGWYLWHWPILSFLRVSRLGDEALLHDVIGGGLIAFLLACISYRFIEQPIRNWNAERARLKPLPIVAVGVGSCVALAALGGLSGYAGYSWIRSYTAAHYGTEGKGVLDNGCRVITTRNLPDRCLEGKYGVLLGDSHADALSGSLTRIFSEQKAKLIFIGRGGCSPLFFSPQQRQKNRTHRCANLLMPFEKVMGHAQQPDFVIITAAWQSQNLLSERNLVELLSQFDPVKTRVILIGPVPVFNKPVLDCVVIGDRYGAGRERCTKPRARVERERAASVKILKAAAQSRANTRYIDPVDVFCAEQTCQAFKDNQVFYNDGGHVMPSGVERIYDTFKDDFRWVAE
jgi:peptidoglycan/LPS O-acetylase OafA/YrhL